MNRFAGAAIAAAISLSLPLPAQVLQPGHAATVRALPGNASCVLVLPQPGGDDLVWFTGTDLVLAAAGAPPVVLHHWAAPTFGGVTIAGGSGNVLFGDAGSGDLWSVPLQPGQPSRQLANLPLLYDAAMLDATHAVVSARTGGYGAPDNDLIVVDLQTGSTQPIARVPGASGPLLVDAQGDLLYATASLAFPAPPGTVAVLRFPGAAVAAARLGHFVLDASNATTVASGLDAVADLAVDDDGDLQYVDWMRGEVAELRRLGNGTPVPTVLLQYGSAAVAAAALQFVGAAGAQFEPFQPVGARLLVQETDFVAISQLRIVQPQRPRTDVPGGQPVPRGAFALVVDQAPANGLGVIAFGLVGSGGELPLQVPGFRQLLHWDQAMLSPLAVLWAPLDASGRAALSLNNPGLPGGVIGTAQAIVLSAAGDLLGSTAPRPLQFAP